MNMSLSISQLSYFIGVRYDRFISCKAARHLCIFLYKEIWQLGRLFAFQKATCKYNKIMNHLFIRGMDACISFQPLKQENILLNVIRMYIFRFHLQLFIIYCSWIGHKYDITALHFYQWFQEEMSIYVRKNLYI